MRSEKIIPVLAVIVVLVILIVVFLPGWLRLLSFKFVLNRFVHLVKVGQIYESADYVVPADYEDAVNLIKKYVPTGYEDDISALNVKSIERVEDGYAVILLVKLEGENYRWVGRARMHWRKTEDGYKFTLPDLAVAEFISDNWVYVGRYLGAGSLDDLHEPPTP